MPRNLLIAACLYLVVVSPATTAFVTPHRAALLPVQQQQQKKKQQHVSKPHFRRGPAASAPLQLLSDSSSIISRTMDESTNLVIAVGGFATLVGLILAYASFKKDNEPILPYEDDEDPQLSQYDLLTLTSQLRDKVEVEKSRPMDDRVKQMWMNRERLQTVAEKEAAPAPPAPPPLKNSADYMAGLGGSSSLLTSYSPSKWSPGGGSNNQVSSATATASPTLVSAGAQTTTWAPPPAPAPSGFVASSGDYMTSLSGAQPRKSYSMSNWTPFSQVASAATVGSSSSSSSYLANMSTTGASFTTMTAATAVAAPMSPAPTRSSAKPSSSPVITHYTNVAKAVVVKKSYTMTKWSPGRARQSPDTLPLVGGYATNLAGASATTTVPVPKKSYTMTSWSPNQAMAPAFPNVVSSISAAGTITAEPKKSYAMSSWSPNAPLNVAATTTTTGSTSYLANLASAATTVSPASTPSWSAPAVSPPAPTPASSGGDYLSNLVGGSGAVASAVKKSYAMTSWSPDKAAPATSVSSTSAVSSSAGPKKSYSMTSWSPNAPLNVAATTGSSSSYLASMSSGATIVSPASTLSYGSAPVASPPDAAPASSGDYMSNLAGGGVVSGAVKKSYAMTSWSPNKAAPATSVSSTSAVSSSAGPKKSYSMTSWSPNAPLNVAATTGSSSSYLANMSSGATTVYPASTPSYGPAPVPSPPVAAPAPSGDYMSNLAGGGGVSGSVKKSYAMTSWSPDKAAPATSTSSISSVPAPVQPSNAASTGNYLSSISAESTGLETKSYSMSKWSPDSVLKSDVSSSSSSSGLAYTDSAVAQQASYVALTTVPAPVPPPPAYTAPVPSVSPLSAPASSGDYLSYLSGGSSVSMTKKSYSMSDWYPGARVNNAVSNAYLTNMNYAPRPTAPIAPSYPAATPEVILSAPAIVSPVSLPPVPAQAPLPNADYLTTIAGVSRTDGLQRSNAMTSWSPGNKVSNVFESKKSYSISGWSPNSQGNVAAVTGSSSSYLANMSSATTTVSPASTPSYASAPVSSPSAPAPASNGDYMSNLAGGGGVPGVVKKSYAMTSWSPNKAAPETSTSSISSISSTAGPKKSYSTTSWSPNSPVIATATTGSSSSYLANMSSGATNVYPASTPSYGPAPVPSPPAAAPASSGDYVSNLAGGGDMSGVVKKSYAMTSWSPDKAVVGTVSSSSSSSSSAASTAGPKKSYAMSSWSPNSPVAAAAAAGSSSSYLATMSSGASPTAPVYSSSGGQTFVGGSSGFGLAKPSYSGSNWSPTGDLNGSGTGSGSSSLNSATNGSQLAPESSHAPLSNTATAPPAQARSSFDGAKKSSYGPSKWSPDKGVPELVL